MLQLWLRYLMLKITHNYKLCCLLNNWKFFVWLVLCFSFNNSAKSLPNSTFRGGFGILRKSRIQNCHWNSILSHISWRKTGKRTRQVKPYWLYIITPQIQPQYYPCLSQLMFLSSVNWNNNTNKQSTYYLTLLTAMLG